MLIDGALGFGLLVSGCSRARALLKRHDVPLVFVNLQLERGVFYHLFDVLLVCLILNSLLCHGLLTLSLSRTY